MHFKSELKLNFFFASVLLPLILAISRSWCYCWCQEFPQIFFISTHCCFFFILSIFILWRYHMHGLRSEPFWSHNISCFYSSSLCRLWCQSNEMRLFELRRKKNRRNRKQENGKEWRKREKNEFMTNFLSLLKRNIIVHDGSINFRII